MKRVIGPGLARLLAFEGKSFSIQWQSLRQFSERRNLLPSSEAKLKSSMNLSFFAYCSKELAHAHAQDCARLRTKQIKMIEK